MSIRSLYTIQRILCIPSAHGHGPCPMRHGRVLRAALALPRICFVIEAYFSQANLESDRQIFDKFLVRLPTAGPPRRRAVCRCALRAPNHHGQVRAQLPTRYFLITPPSLCCALVWNHHHHCRHRASSSCHQEQGSPVVRAASRARSKPNGGATLRSK